MDSVIENINALEADRQKEEIPQKNKSINVREIRKYILYLAIPSIIQFLLQMTLGIADLAFVGRLGAVPAAACGLAWQMMWIFNLLFFAVSGGTSAIVARYVGAKDEKGARLVAGQSLMLTSVISVVTTVIFIISAESVFRLLGTEQDVFELAVSFFKMLSCGYIFSSLLLTSFTILRAAGDTRSPMFITGIMSVSNIILDYAMIYGKFGFPAHGALGSAEASVIVQFLCALVLVGGLFAGSFKIRVTADSFARFDWPACRKIFALGIPVAAEHSFWTIASLVIIWVVSGAGTLQLAVHNIVARAESISFMPGIGLSVAAGVAVGQALGEGNPEKARVSAWESMKIGMLIMGSVGLFFALFPRLVVGIFSNQPEVLSLGARVLFIIAIIQPIQAIDFVLLGAFKGAGDTKTAMWITFVTMLLVRIPLVYLFGVTMKLGTPGVWAGVNICNAVGAYICVLRFRGNKWMSVKI